MISASDEIPKKLKLEKRKKDILYNSGDRPALKQIVDHIEAIFKAK